MVGRSLLTFVLLCISYSIYLSGSSDVSFVPKNVDHENYIKAEKYVFDKSVLKKNILIGTSLSYNLKIEQNSEPFYNLSFFAKGMYEGLEILTRSKNAPNRVFIEINFLFGAADTVFINNVFSPITSRAKEHLVMFRKENQFSGVINSHPIVVRGFKYFHLRYRQLLSYSRKKPPSRNSEQGARVTESDSTESKERLNYTQFEVNRKLFHTVPDHGEIAKRIQVLREYITTLQKRNIEVHFFEMPYHRDIQNTPLPQLIRNLIVQHFPRHSIYFSDPQKTYKTSDGIHLQESSLAIFEADFKEWLNKI